jgi:hypothetical protein
MIAFRYVDAASLQKEKDAIVQAKARLIQVCDYNSLTNLAVASFTLLAINPALD